MTAVSHGELNRRGQPDPGLGRELIHQTLRKREPGAYATRMQLPLPFLPQALVLFARPPRVEQQVKPLGARGEEIHRAVLTTVLTAVRGLAPDVDLVLAGDQERDLLPIARQIVGEERRIAGVPVFGDGFGARYRSALEGTIALGYGPVVILAGDVADLRVRHLVRALALLADGDPLVLGPATDGGLYLLGLSKAPGALLERIPWRGPRVAYTLRDRATELGIPVTMLEPLGDVDDAAAVRALRVRLQRLQPNHDLTRTVVRVLDSVGVD